MKIAVIGGNGYIGQALISSLLSSTDHDISSLSLHAESRDNKNPRVRAVNTDVFNTEQLHSNLSDCDIVYYLVHMMAQTKMDFAEAESEAAHSVVEAVKGTVVKKIIFLGGLGNDTEKLSKHLKSRHHTGKILRESDAQVIEFRASMVIGHGSVSYDIIANLVHRLPLLALPTWAKTYTQPIGLNDAVTYLVEALTLTSNHDEIVEIGGPEAMTYEDLMRRYAAWKKTNALFFHVPFVPVFVAAWWLNSFTPGHHAKVGRVMVESLENPMIVTNDKSKELFPNVVLTRVEDCFV